MEITFLRLQGSWLKSDCDLLLLHSRMPRNTTNQIPALENSPRTQNHLLLREGCSLVLYSCWISPWLYKMLSCTSSGSQPKYDWEEQEARWWYPYRHPFNYHFYLNLLFSCTSLPPTFLLPKYTWRTEIWQTKPRPHPLHLHPATLPHPSVAYFTPKMMNQPLRQFPV